MGVAILLARVVEGVLDWLGRAIPGYPLYVRKPKSMAVGIVSGLCAHRI